MTRRGVAQRLFQEQGRAHVPQDGVAHNVSVTGGLAATPEGQSLLIPDDGHVEEGVVVRLLVEVDALCRGAVA